jgi:hypothetical protein
MREENAQEFRRSTRREDGDARASDRLVRELGVRQIRHHWKELCNLFRLGGEA